MNTERRPLRRNWFRRRIVFHLALYAVVVAILIAVNAALGGRWWSLSIAAVWGGLLLLRFVVAALLWRPRGRLGAGRRFPNP